MTSFKKEWTLIPWPRIKKILRCQRWNDAWNKMHSQRVCFHFMLKDEDIKVIHTMLKNRGKFKLNRDFPSEKIYCQHLLFKARSELTSFVCQVRKQFFSGSNHFFTLVNACFSAPSMSLQTLCDKWGSDFSQLLLTDNFQNIEKSSNQIAI